MNEDEARRDALDWANFWKRNYEVVVAILAQTSAADRAAELDRALREWAPR